MEKHKWTLEDDEFLLELGELRTRFNDEGIHQQIILSVNGNKLYESNWGIENFLESFTKNNSEIMGSIQYINNQITYICRKEEDASVFKRMTANESTEFIKWLFFCKLPKTEQRNLKIKQWKERQSD